MSDIVYKIRRKSDGLFSTGGCDPKFNRVGKTWSTKGALNGHLTLVRDGLTYQKQVHRLEQTYRGCDVVTFLESGHLPVIQWRGM